MSFQAYLDNAERSSGRTPQQLVDEAAELGLTEHAPIVAWLAERYGLGRGHANAVSHVIRKGPQFEVRHTTGTHRDASGTLRLSGVDTA